MKIQIRTLYDAIATSIGMGLFNDAKDLLLNPIKQQQQLEAQKKALAQQNDASYELWQKTNYPAQVQAIQHAGLNPALLYGMGGAGGSTLGGSNAMPENNRSTPMDLAAAGQLELINAQAKALEAKARLDNVEADKKQGVDTELGKTQIQSLLQGIDNAKAQKALTQAHTRLTTLEADLKEMTIDDAAAQVKANLWKTNQELQTLTRENDIGEATKQTKIDTIRQVYLNMLTEKALMQAQTGKALTGQMVDVADVKLKAQQVVRLIQEHWEELDKIANNAQANNTEINKYQEEIAQNMNKPIEQAMDLVKMIMQAVSLGGALKYSPARPPIGFKK